MKIESMKSGSGRSVPNQFSITDDMGNRFFQSYKSIVIKIVPRTGAILGRTITLDKLTWDYSRTTAKYRNQFLCEDTKTIKAKIKNGEYALENLNQ